MVELGYALIWIAVGLFVGWLWGQVVHAMNGSTSRSDDDEPPHYSSFR